MQEISRAELIKKLAEKANTTEDEAREYLSVGDEYVDGLPEDIKDIDGDEQLNYVYENSNLDPEVIERLSDAELEVLYK